MHGVVSPMVCLRQSSIILQSVLDQLCEIVIHPQQGFVSSSAKEKQSLCGCGFLYQRQHHMHIESKLISCSRLFSEARHCGAKSSTVGIDSAMNLLTINLPDINIT